jgi:multiple sugar transport system permease protein
MLPNSSNYPLPIGLQDLLSATPAFNPGQGGQVPIYRPELAIATIVAMAPVMIVFLFAQRSLVSGLLAGATKE